jgi:hypothetical protein
VRGLITPLAHLVFCFLFLPASDGWRIVWFGIAVEQSLLTLAICFGSLAGDLRFFAVACLPCGSRFDLRCLSVSQVVG